jgi:hypothetical protein
MRSGVAVIVLLGLAILAAAAVVNEGGKRMSVQHNDTGAGIALPSLDTHRSGSLETATFALG